MYKRYELVVKHLLHCMHVTDVCKICRIRKQAKKLLRSTQLRFDYLLMFSIKHEA